MAFVIGTWSSYAFWFFSREGFWVWGDFWDNFFRLVFWCWFGWWRRRYRLETVFEHHASGHQFRVQRCLDRGIVIILQRLRCFNDGSIPSLLWVAHAICFAKPLTAFCILTFCLSFSASRAAAFFSMSNLMAPVVLRRVHYYLWGDDGDRI